METEAEWKFVNGWIQRFNIPGFTPDEWHIGLRKQGRGWKWVSGRGLAIRKWQGGEPDEDGDYAEMARDYPKGTRGLFNVPANCVQRAYICELPKGNRKIPKIHYITKHYNH